METKNGNGLMKMRELSQASGLPVSTIKFYMAKGLLPAPRKVKPNVAYYDQAFLDRLMVVRSMREEGLSVRSIKNILDRYPFRDVADWNHFRERARNKSTQELADVERLAALSDEERRREEILDAAFRVFSSRGYRTATMDDIASEAQVSKGTCYQYFPSKEEIFVATMERSLRLLLSEAGRAAGEARDALTRLGLEGLSFISRYREIQFMFTSVVTEALAGNRRLKERAADAYRQVAEFLAEDIRRGIEEGAFRPVDPLNVAYALIGIAEIAGNMHVLEEGFDVPAFFVKLMDFIQHGLSTARVREGKEEAKGGRARKSRR
ncbi:MAG: TetR family transcriptional regulator [Actinomycetota bacterium]